jgi:hypothetical protein
MSSSKVRRRPSSVATTLVIATLAIAVVGLAGTVIENASEDNTNRVFLRKKLLESGDFKWVPDPKGGADAIRILGDWEKENILTVEVPQLKEVKDAKSGRIKFHRLGVDQLKKAFAEIEEKKLLDLVLTWDGSFAPRTIRGSTTSLSNHAFGTAFDINQSWNRLGGSPAREGSPGSVIELVPIFEKYGFFWGGHFSRAEGCHFELLAPSGGDAKP